jgi:hypothetical protein
MISFPHSILGTEYTVTATIDADVDDDGAPVGGWEFALSAGGVKLSVDDVAYFTGVDVDDLRDALTTRVLAICGERSADSYAGQLADDDYEPDADALEAGFDHYAGSYSDDL